MTELRLAPEDECCHPVEEAPTFQESMYANVLDPEAGNVTIETLQRAAELVGRRVKIELVSAE